MFLSLVLQDYRIPVCAQLLVMIVIAGRLSLLGFVFKPVSWLAGDSRLRQTFSLRIHLVERQSLSPISPSTIILLSYRSLEASLSTSASRSIAGPTLLSLDRNKPVTIGEGLSGSTGGSSPEPCAGLTGAGSIVVLLALGVAIWNADWRERVSEGGGDTFRSSVAVSIASPVCGGRKTSSAAVERLRGGGDGRESQSL